MVGFNLFDEQWTSASTTTIVGSKVPVFPNTSYHGEYFISSTTGLQLYFGEYDANDNLVAANIMTGGAKAKTFTTTATTAYIKPQINHAVGSAPTNFKTCLHLRWDGERDGEYEAYSKESYALDDITLRGIPKVSNGSLYYDGDTYEPDGKVTRNIDEATVSITSIYERTGNATCNFALFTLPNSWKTLNTILASKLLSKSSENFDSETSTGKLLSYDSDTKTCAISILKATTLAQAQSAYNGIKLVYELATPSVEETNATPYTNPQVVDDWGTEEFVDTRSVAIPVGHITQYQPNLKAKLETAPNSPSDGNGNYIVSQTSGENTYIKLSTASEITALNTRVPAPPTTAGTYRLQVVVPASGSPTYSWVSAT